MSAVELKERARQIIECLAKLDQSKRPGGGVHGQVIGMEPYVIRTNGDGLQCLYEAQSLLDELLDPFDRLPAPQVALTDALPELPPLPMSEGTITHIESPYNPVSIKTGQYKASQMQAYARQYAAQCIEARNQQGDAVDAERYRVIRDSADVSFDAAVWIVTDSGARINVTCGARSELDRMADAAIEQRKADKKGGV